MLFKKIKIPKDRRFVEAQIYQGFLVAGFRRKKSIKKKLLGGKR